MLDDVPEELLFPICDFLPLGDLLKLTQVSRRYRRILKTQSDARRYETVTVIHRSGLNKFSVVEGTCCNFDTLSIQ